jgi:murein L,D-transpeptidase YcbB/YkuD
MGFSRHGSILISTVLACLAVGIATPTGAAVDPETIAAIRGVIEAGRHPDLRWSEFPYYKDEMQGLYGTACEPFWLQDGQPRPQVRAVLDAMADAASRGLDPDDYDVAALETTWRSLSDRGSLSPRELGLFDTALSVDFMRFISDLHIGRITPRKVGVGFDATPKKYDLPAVLRKAVQEDRIAATIDAAEPQLALYRRLKTALQQYRQLAQNDKLPAVPAGATVRPGEACTGCSALATRLAAFGDLAAADAAGAANGTYSEPLVEAVKRLQARHGLATDGALGPGTRAAIDVPPSRRVRQIELALERLRWLPELDPGPFVAVNIPAFHVWGFDSLNAAGGPALSMRVVVGKALDTRTPIFEENMEYIVFRPYWNVPYSIVKQDLVPALRRDSQALAKRDMELVRGFDDAKPQPVTSESASLLAQGKLLVRQKPGPKNSLGLAKFIFPNANNIYMHGTPSTALFERARRDFSHGCIRLENPAAMAEWVLRDQPQWTREKIEAAMSGAKPVRANLRRPMPVIIYYSTCLVDLEGKAHFYDDIYKHDERLEDELRTAYSYQP